MVIHVVKLGDTLESISDLYGVSVTRLIQDNGLKSAIVVGQSLAILIPEITYTVKEGDTLKDIADFYNITIMQLLKNNPYLSESEYLYPGEILVIKYNTMGKITTKAIRFHILIKKSLKKHYHF